MKKTIASLATAVALGLASAQALALDCNTSFTGGSETTPNGRYTDNENLTITDNDTGLMWMKCAAGKTGGDCTVSIDYAVDPLVPDQGIRLLNWMQAMQYAEQVNTTLVDTEANPSGDTDWRVPNAKELESLVERCRTSPAINTSVFGKDTPKSWESGKYWTSTPAFRPDVNQTTGDVPYQAWAIDFQWGNDWRQHKTDKIFYVRLVRTAD